MRTYLAVLFSLWMVTGVQAQQRSASATDTIFEGKPIRAWIAQLADTPVDRSMQARQAVGRMGERAKPYLPAITDLLAGNSIIGRAGAANALGNLRGVAAPAVPALVRAMSDPVPPVRTAAAQALGDIGIATPEAVAAVEAGTKDSAPLVRRFSFYALRQFGKTPVPALRRALQDPDAHVRLWALRSLADLGPSAREAVPEVAALLSDTVTKAAARMAPVPFMHTEAAWALSQILPRRVPHAVTMRATIRPGHSLRDDGRGPLVNRLDSVSVHGCEALAIFTQWYGPLNCRESGPKKPNAAPRALVLDLSQPASPGAVPLGIVRDDDAQVHAFWKVDRERRFAHNIFHLEPSPDAVPIERMEVVFHLNGEKHVLQFGPWAQGLFNRAVAVIHGEGTTQAQVVHPNASQWRILTPPGAVGRLWNVQNREKPVDRGLYRFSFDMDFERLAAEDGSFAVLPVIAEKPQ